MAERKNNYNSDCLEGAPSNFYSISTNTPIQCMKQENYVSMLHFMRIQVHT
jgi:hypothetical protein